MHAGIACVPASHAVALPSSNVALTRVLACVHGVTHGNGDERMDNASFVAPAVRWGVFNMCFLSM